MPAHTSHIDTHDVYAMHTERGIAYIYCAKLPVAVKDYSGVGMGRLYICSLFTYIFILYIQIHTDMCT